MDCTRCNEKIVRRSPLLRVCDECYQCDDLARFDEVPPGALAPRGDIIGFVVCFDLTTGSYRHHKAVRRSAPSNPRESA